MNSHSVRHLLASCLPVERSQIGWGVAVRTSITMVVALGLATQTDNLELGVPFALGVFLTNLSDMNEPPWLRWRTMLATAVACALATLLGGLVSESAPVHLAVAFAVAAGVGSAGALGLKGSLAGMFCLALFSLYAGSDIGGGVAWMDAAAMAAGGGLAVASAMLDAPRQFRAHCPCSDAPSSSWPALPLRAWCWASICPAPPLPPKRAPRLRPRRTR